MIRSSISLKVGFVLMLYDDFTNSFINTNAVKINVDKDQKLVRKENGCFVFLQCGKEKIEIVIESTIYVSEKITVDLDKLEGKPPVVKVRLLPSVCYPVSSGCTCITGKAKSGTIIYGFFENQKNAIKLLCDYHKETDKESIKLYQDTVSELDGKTFCIQNKEKEQKEYCKMEGEIEIGEGSYKLSSLLKHSYPKIGTVLFPVSIGRADENGDYFIPIKESSDKEICLQMIDLEKKEDNLKIITINKGGINRLDW